MHTKSHIRTKQTKYELNMAIVMIFVKSPFKTYESQKKTYKYFWAKILGNGGLDNYQSKYHIKVKVVCIWTNIQMLSKKKIKEKVENRIFPWVLSGGSDQFPQHFKCWVEAFLIIFLVHKSWTPLLSVSFVNGSRRLPTYLDIWNRSPTHVGS